MRRLATVVASIAALVAATAGPAAAQSVTVDGSGDITKMFASNGDKAAVAKVYGLDKPCDAQYLNVKVSSKREGYYQAEAGCYGTQWLKGLYYHSSADDQGPSKVSCDGFRFTYNADSHFYKVKMPRSCLDHAPNRVRFASEGHDYASAMPGEAGPTKLLDRG
jgi:hypothetical protein